MTMVFTYSFPRSFLYCCFEALLATKLELWGLIADMVGGQCNHPSQPRFMGKKGSKLANDLSSPGSANVPEHVVIVMDGLKEFNTELLEWVLENITASGHIITFLGFVPWLNIPLSSKTRQDVWMLEFEDFSVIKEKNDWKNDAKYLKLQGVFDLCKKHGVVLQKQIVMGNPLPLLVVERIKSLGATWVVFDSNRYMRKNKEFFAEKIPCNIVMMSEERYIDMIKGPSMIVNGEHTPSESPASLVPTPQVMYSEPLKRVPAEQEPEKEDV